MDGASNFYHLPMVRLMVFLNPILSQYVERTEGWYF